MLLKVHSVELHAKLLRGCALAAHAGPIRRRLTAGRLTLVHPRARGPAVGLLRGGFLGGRAPARTRARSCVPGQRRPCAYREVDVRIKGLPRIFSGSRVLHARPGAVVPRSQTTSPTTPDCQRFSPRWSALWAPHQPKPRADRHQMGTCAVRGARLSLAHVEGATKRGELHQ